MKPKLKPCPFCGKQVDKMEVFRDKNEDVINVAIRCEHPGCYAAVLFTFSGLNEFRGEFPDDSEDDIDATAKKCAAKQWNRRAK